jgi:2C-methyl-D-erythritol 2,4-cyclodiphosphate synthase
VKSLLIVGFLFRGFRGFLFIYEKYFDHAEDTISKSEVTQSNINANMEIKEQKLGQHEIMIDTSIRNTLQIRLIAKFSTMRSI